jgi:hypothetical protein
MPEFGRVNMIVEEEKYNFEKLGEYINEIM